MVLLVVVGTGRQSVSFVPIMRLWGSNLGHLPPHVGCPNLYFLVLLNSNIYSVDPSLPDETFTLISSLNKSIDSSMIFFMNKDNFPLANN